MKILRRLLVLVCISWFFWFFRTTRVSWKSKSRSQIVLIALVWCIKIYKKKKLVQQQLGPRPQTWMDSSREQAFFVDQNGDYEVKIATEDQQNFSQETSLRHCRSLVAVDRWDMKSYSQNIVNTFEKSRTHMVIGRKFFCRKTSHVNVHLIYLGFKMRRL